MAVTGAVATPASGQQHARIYAAVDMRLHTSVPVCIRILHIGVPRSLFTKEDAEHGHMPWQHLASQPRNTRTEQRKQSQKVSKNT
jgi:hypothetical protein